MMTTMDMPQLPSGEYVNRSEYNRRMGVDDMPIQRLQPTSPQQQQMANMRARDMAMAQLDSRGTPISYGGESPGFGRGAERQPAYQPATQDQPQIRPYRTESADRVGVPSMNQLMSGIYGGGFNPYMGGGMGRGMGRGMSFGGFNPYMGGGGMGFGGFNPYMGGRGMGRGGFNPYMAQPQPPPMPMQLPDFARQMYGIGQRTNPYMPTAMMPESTSGQPLHAYSGQMNPQVAQALQQAMANPTVPQSFSSGIRGNPYVSAFF